MITEKETYDVLVLTTPSYFKRLNSQYYRYLMNLPVRDIYVLGSSESGALLAERKQDPSWLKGQDPSRLKFLNEEEILSFDSVHVLLSDILREQLRGQELLRGNTGWYYQQFLKFEYAKKCSDRYYLVWDGDTFPCTDFSMFSDNGKPFLDVKEEYHEEYFKTIGKLFPGMSKVIGPSFISEHMLFDREIVLELIGRIEANHALAGTSYWEKILRCIEPDKISKSSFSEFETYGTYTALNHPEAYRIRDWHSFRLGGGFYDPNTICDRDYDWLGHDFQAISFEKDHHVREDHKNLFDNPEYQSKLTARQMVEAMQQELKDGYIETWNRDSVNRY